jgi:hypothetical protein
MNNLKLTCENKKKVEEKLVKEECVKCQFVEECPGPYMDYREQRIDRPVNDRMTKEYYF